MAISGITSSGSLTADYQSSFKARMQSMKNLESALSSGDLSAAQSAFSSLQSNAPTNGGNSQAKTDFEALGKALESGDISAAQEAFKTIQSNAPKGGQGMGGPGGPPPSGGGGADQFKSDMDALGKALESGDLDAAKQALATIQKNMPKDPSSSTSDSDSDSDSSTSSTNSTDDPRKLFEQLSSALQSGDLSTANSLYSSLMSGMEKHQQALNQSNSAYREQLDMVA